MQLRETPTFLKVPIEDSEVTHNESQKNENGHSNFQEIENGNKNFRYVLQPRKRLNVTSFLQSRFVGLLPILWLGLLINVPSWMLPGNYTQPMTTQVHKNNMY